jgi:regulator of PEP synthase PpsR (kinase-PPPase family)
VTGRRLILALSDATGETAEQCCRAALAQFGHPEEVQVRVLGHVLDERALAAALEEARRLEALVVYTLVGRELRKRLQELVEEMGVTAVDVLGPLMARVARLVGRSPKAVPGLGHELTEEYFQRIAAVEFAVNNDDGKNPHNLPKADIVIVGLSRTSKTPLSNYIAQRGYRVANVPVVMGIPLPRQLDQVDPRRVFALTLDPVTLKNIRRTRMEALGMAPDSDYGDLRQIRREAEHAAALYAQHPEWTQIDVTQKAVEETAALVLEAWRARFETPPE